MSTPKVSARKATVAPKATEATHWRLTEFQNPGQRTFKTDADGNVYVHNAETVTISDGVYGVEIVWSDKLVLALKATFETVEAAQKVVDHLNNVADVITLDRWDKVYVGHAASVINGIEF